MVELPQEAGSDPSERQEDAMYDHKAKRDRHTRDRCAVCGQPVKLVQQTKQFARTIHADEDAS